MQDNCYEAAITAIRTNGLGNVIAYLKSGHTGAKLIQAKAVMEALGNPEPSAYTEMDSRECIGLTLASIKKLKTASMIKGLGLGPNKLFKRP